MNRSGTITVRYLAILALALAAGCGTGKLDNATVSGTVTFQNKPITGGQVTLFDSSIGIGASAPLGPDGSFKVDGPIRAGKYVVTILPPPAPPPLPDGVTRTPQTASYVPEKYRNEKTSDLKVDVVAGSNQLDLVLRP